MHCTLTCSHLTCDATQTPMQSQKLSETLSSFSTKVPVVLTAVAKREHRYLPPYLRQHGPAEQTLTLTDPTVLFNATSILPRILCVSMRIFLHLPSDTFTPPRFGSRSSFAAKDHMIYSQLDSLSPLTPSAAYNSLSPNRSVVEIPGSSSRIRVRTQTARFLLDRPISSNHYCALAIRTQVVPTRQCCQSFSCARACGEAIYHIIRRRRLGIQRLGFANSFKLFLRPVPVLYSAAHGA